jgi:uncharacterized protein (DUF1501 family)
MSNEHLGCAEYNRSLASRRSFLKGLGLVAAGGVAATVDGSVFRQVAFAESGEADNVMVVLSLRGGVDGLSLVVPYAEKNYYDARKTIAIPQTELLATDGRFGLHPNFAPLLTRWKSGQMAAVHAVGLPMPNRSHFSAIQEIEDADAGTPERIGWLNRMIGTTEPDSLFAAVEIGHMVPHTQVYGPQPVLACDDISVIDFYGPRNEMDARKDGLKITWKDVGGVLGPAARDAMEVAEEWGPVRDSPEDPEHGAKYPKSGLADALAQTARLVRANVGAEVVTIDYGSWDMHTDLGTLDWGDMRLMVDDLARSLDAFFVDLGDLSSKVTVVTISEFGRRVAENGSKGLDHGYGNVMLALGAGVKGGQYYAQWPGLDPHQLNEGDLAVTRDYRSVLSEVVRTRFPNADMSKVFPDFKPEQIGLMVGA